MVAGGIQPAGAAGRRKQCLMILAMQSRGRYKNREPQNWFGGVVRANVNSAANRHV